MSILDQAYWSEVRGYFRIEYYGRDRGPRGNRWRIEVNDPQNRAVARRFTTFTMPCVECGHPVQPIRNRNGEWHSLYFSCTCPLDVNIRCSRSSAARLEYQRVRAALEGTTPPPHESSLF